MGIFLHLHCKSNKSCTISLSVMFVSMLIPGRLRTYWKAASFGMNMFNPVGCVISCLVSGEIVWIKLLNWLENSKKQSCINNCLHIVVWGCFQINQKVRYNNNAMFKLSMENNVCLKIIKTGHSLFTWYLRNRSTLAVNCWVTYHGLEVSCKVDYITRLKLEWHIYLQLANKPWFITQQFTQ